MSTTILYKKKMNLTEYEMFLRELLSLSPGGTYHISTTCGEIQLELSKEVDKQKVFSDLYYWLERRLKHGSSSQSS